MTDLLANLANFFTIVSISAGGYWYWRKRAQIDDQTDGNDLD